MRHARLLTFLSVAVMTATLAPTHVSAQEAEADESDAISLKLGINFSLLDRPADNPGDLTILAGSAFTGSGIVVGATYELTGLVPFLSFESGLFYAHSSAVGFEIRGIEEREILLEVDTIRLPLWTKLEVPFGSVLRGVVGLGPEVVIGFASSSTVREQNIPLEDAAVLRTQSVTSLHLTAILGLEIDAGPVVVPLSFHASLNPFTGATTAQRLEGQQADESGPFRVEFDFELLGMFGIAMEM